MEITDIVQDGITILELKGRLDTTNYSFLEEKIMKLIEDHHHNILVDCNDLSYISSSGLRIMLMGLKKINLVKGKFFLCCLQENIREIFEISGFTSIFSIYSTRQEALKQY
ncbi:MAG: STAS domain-containing protein [Bacteroidales bacterium]|nr:STAS domain-containing protein [Lentimicrobiaceae bacterium]MDD5696086.1 STAS domain-containing protein [Bacteroidales bacterium]